MPAVPILSSNPSFYFEEKQYIYIYIYIHIYMPLHYSVTLTVLYAVFSTEGGDQQCCYGGKGQLLSFAEGGGSVSRFSATLQPIKYMLQDYWPKIVCSQLTNTILAYQELRPTDDCTGYELPS